MKLRTYCYCFAALWLAAAIVGTLCGDEAPKASAETSSEVSAEAISYDSYWAQDPPGSDDDEVGSDEKQPAGGEEKEAPGQLVSTPAREAAMLQDQPPTELPLEQQTQTALPTSASQFLSLFSGDREAIYDSLSPERQQRAAGSGIDVVLGRESGARHTADAGDLLRKSNQALGIATQSRTPIVTDTLTRGRRNGQQAGAGSYWFPARQDLDTLLSKLDSRIISDIITVKGPYSALYGPGLAFYDVELLPAPRYSCGFETHGSTSFDYKTNGEQVYGRQTIWGGDANWGFRVGYGHRTGNDYEDGSGVLYPSSYKSRDLDVALGVDIAAGKTIDFHYIRLDQTDVEFPGQIFDFDFLATDAYDVEYVDECNPYFDRFVVEGWYNQTRFAGNAQGAGKRQQIPFLDAIMLTSFTDVHASSTGFRVAGTWGLPDCPQLTAGLDLRHLRQQLDEFSSSPLFPVSPQNNPIPKSHHINPGLFVEASVPMSDRLTLRAGARADWVASGAQRFVPGADFDGDGNPDDLEAFLGAPFDQDFNLGLAYLSGEYELNCAWSLLGGLGYAMRAPTMTELYAVTPFLAVFPQYAFTSPVGNPTLDPEQLYQVDIGLRGEYCHMRCGVTGFYSWIRDYITFDSITPSVVYSFVNTELATLAGGEAYAEYDVNCWLTAFGHVSYVEGRDHTRDGSVSLFRQNNAPGTPRSGVAGTPAEPLAVIYPLDSRVGLRIHEAVEAPAWSVEVSARVVDNQDRIATTLQEQFTPGFTTVDLRTYWRCRENLVLTFGVENLGDRTYQEHFDPHVFATVFQPGHTIYMGAEWVY